MPTINRSALVPYSAQAMYDLVNDVDAYVQFLPWCKSSQVLARSEDEVRASIQLARGAVQKSFTTVNRLQPGKMIEIRLVEGPFRHLQGFWRFESLGDQGCKVLLDLEFEFSNRLVSMTVGPVFHQIASTLVDAFTRRAEEVYGRG